MTNKALIVTLFISFFSYHSVFSQSQISLDEAIDVAIENNLTVKNEVLKAAYKKQLIKTSATIPQAEVSAEWGKLNSSFNDSKFGISQAFSFPSVYTKQRKLLTEEWDLAVLGVDLKKAEIRRNVSHAFYSILYLRKKEGILLENDSLYLEFLRKSELRFSTGESNVLEKTTAESQRGAIKLQLNQLKQEIELAKLQFQLLLNSSIAYEPHEDGFKARLAPHSADAVLAGHPVLKLLEQEQSLASAQTQVEKSKLLPELNLGYFNSSMIGNGADDVYYSSSKRFQYGSVGIGLPIFSGAQKAKITASKLNENLAEQNYLLGIQNLQNSYQSALVNYKSQLESLNYFEDLALENAKLIKATATKQFEIGEIDYLTWVILINQSISIQNEYLEAVNNLNQSTIQLNFLIEN